MNLLRRLFGKSKYPRYAGRFRTRDANDVFSENIFNKLPSGAGILGQSVRSIIRHASSAALIAHAGGGQANALLLTSVMNEIITVASANDSVRMPPATAGVVMMIANAAATNSANVYPASGEKFNGGSADAAFALAAGKRMYAFCVAAGNWYTVLTA